jgi:hypothetical protein
MALQILSASRSSRLRRRAGVTWRSVAIGVLLLLAALAIFAVYRH